MGGKWGRRSRKLEKGDVSDRAYLLGPLAGISSALRAVCTADSLKKNPAILWVQHNRKGLRRSDHSPRAVVSPQVYESDGGDDHQPWGGGCG